MSLYGVPFLLANIGAQTVYVIDQRLRDQSIPRHKAQKILCDICAVLFSETLWDQVITPQEIYTAESTRSVLEKIVHSSLIKLNNASMTKLFDLAQMVFKHQILVCSKPSALWTMTKKHIETIQHIVPQLKELKECSRSIARFEALSKSFSGSEWLKLRQTLLEFLRDKKVKITMLMKDGYQSSSGEIANLDRREDVDSVGSVSMHRFQALKKGQKRVSSHPLSLPAYTDSVKRKRMLLAPDEFVCNLYSQESKASTEPSSSAKVNPLSKGKKGSATGSAGTGSPAPASPSTGLSRSSSNSKAQDATATTGSEQDAMASSKTTAAGIDGGVELNSLAAMIGAKRNNTQTPSKLSIFADSIVVDEQSEDYQPPETMQAVKLVEDLVLETKNLAARQNLEKVVDDLNLGQDVAEGEETDDLLDLMDSVA